MERPTFIIPTWPQHARNWTATPIPPCPAPSKVPAVATLPCRATVAFKVKLPSSAESRDRHADRPRASAATNLPTRLRLRIPDGWLRSTNLFMITAALLCLVAPHRSPREVRLGNDQQAEPMANGWDSAEYGSNPAKSLVLGIWQATFHGHRRFTS
ncbi:hypothetical protein CERZMDRAFT_82129 [Cercospora zeae-maydis SCOH1-5]|uniref:Uncharacterized protein n=1 Tax=Cercospora zeae-maydis SCOH1-5 TaxID=717836 RepID=A0A6A6FS30_9PEZI|nr:hypothetical protein CERZMDRAFT_82129 [Cercospora zeae-maydis SCOH1-5]